MLVYYNAVLFTDVKLLITIDELSLFFAGERLSREDKERANYGANARHVVEEEEGDERGTPSREDSTPTLVSTTTTAPDPDTALFLDTLNILEDTEARAGVNPEPGTVEEEIHPNLLDLSFPSKARLEARSNDSDSDSDLSPLFTTLSIGIDRRLIVNRKRQLKMYRVWMQGIFQRL